MGSMSLIHWLIVLVVVLVLFGGGRIPNVMKDVGKGIRGFKEGLRGDAADTDKNDTTRSVPPPKE